MDLTGKQLEITHLTTSATTQETTATVVVYSDLAPGIRQTEATLQVKLAGSFMAINDPNLFDAIITKLGSI